jgi:hypothetical protein
LIGFDSFEALTGTAVPCDLQRFYRFIQTGSEVEIDLYLIVHMDFDMRLSGVPGQPDQPLEAHNI